MILLLTLIGFLVVSAAIVTIVGMTWHDIKAVRHEAAYRKHPHRRRLRARALVSIILPDEPTEACLRSIRRNNYRKREIIFPGEPVRGSLILRLPSNMLLGPTSILDSVSRFNADPSLDFVEIRPVPTAPRTLGQLLKLYRLLALAPFITVRTVFKAAPTRAQWPVMRRRRTAFPNRRGKAYAAATWLLSVANVLAILYACYVATVLRQPDLLILCLFAFGCWMTLAIWQYPSLSVRQKSIYWSLAPVSLGYFCLLAIMAPLGPLRRVAGRDSLGPLGPATSRYPA